MSNVYLILKQVPDGSWFCYEEDNINIGTTGSFDREMCVELTMDLVYLDRIQKAKRDEAVELKCFVNGYEYPISIGG